MAEEVLKKDLESTDGVAAIKVNGGYEEEIEVRAPLAITVIGGLTLATALTLIVIPVVYSLLDRKAFVAEEGAVSVTDDVVASESGELNPGVAL